MALPVLCARLSSLSAGGWLIIQPYYKKQIRQLFDNGKRIGLAMPLVQMVDHILSIFDLSSPVIIGYFAVL